MSEMLTSQQHWRGAESVLREHAGDARAGGKRYQQKIGAVGFANTGGSDTERDTSDGMELISRRSRKIDCHGARSDVS